MLLQRWFCPSSFFYLFFFHFRSTFPYFHKVLLFSVTHTKLVDVQSLSHCTVALLHFASVTCVSKQFKSVTPKMRNSSKQTANFPWVFFPLSFSCFRCVEIVLYSVLSLLHIHLFFTSTCPCSILYWYYNFKYDTFTFFICI